MNVLLVTMDQLRADVAFGGEVDTPAIDSLCASGVAFERHYSQAAPCAPGRAALYTGTYQSNNRVVANGSPLADRFDNIARAVRRAGRVPHLFGYTDQGIDPTRASGPQDPRLEDYAGILPGFEPTFFLPEDQAPWLAWLEDLGHGVQPDYLTALATEPERPAEHSISSFLTDGFLAWLGRQDEPWFAHLSYLRPHPPYAAAGEYSRRYDPDTVTPPIDPAETTHWLHRAAMENPASAAPPTEEGRRRLRSQYYGMVTEVDAQLGRVLDALRASGAWDDTLIVLTADHADQLGDHGLVEKLGYFGQSYHIPLVVRDPSRPEAHALRVRQPTENVDVLPTVLDVMGIDVPAQADGRSLRPFLEGRTPAEWRDAAHYEWDWRYLLLPFAEEHWPAERGLERSNLAVLLDEAGAYVHFGDGSWLLFDLAADPTWRTTSEDPGRALGYAQRMLSWRQEHLERTYTDMLLNPMRPGRWPDLG